MRIFLAPRSNETSYKNFLSTIENGVDYTVIAPHLTGEGKKLLGGKDKIFAWGNKETKKSSWAKMEKGDFVLFYKGREGKEREGKFVYVGRLLHKQHSRELGLSLWPPKPENQPWVCIFFIEDLVPVYIPTSVIADFAGYSRNFIVQGFMPLNEQGTKAILEKYGTIKKFLAHFSGKPGKGISDLEAGMDVNAHSEAQLLLLKIGKILGFDTYSPDKSKEAYGEKLGDYCSLEKMPTRFLGELVPMIKQIDVIWFKDDVPKYAFEVEHTTKFGSGFQRLYQLHPMSTKLFIISSEANLPQFEKFVESAPYFKHRGIFYFKSYRELEPYFKAISEFEAINLSFLGK